MELPELDDLFAERYRIESILGQGGFATVYLAQDEGASRPVALKVLRPDAEGNYLAEIESRFEREVKVVAQLTNIHTVTLFDFGRCEGLLYMVCEYVPGRDLSEVLAEEGVLHPSVVIHILQQILESLSEAHKRGLLHRDIKPENIRIHEYDGDPYCAKLLDFGIARPADQAQGAALTQDGELLGTPRYMAPEQLTEDDMSPATDIYSLGLVALEMMLGPSALLGNRWSDQFDRLITGHVFPIGAYEQIGPSLRALVQKMTAREADERYQSAEATMRALAMVTQHDSEPSEDVPAPALRAAATLEEPRPYAPSGAHRAPPVVAPPRRPQVSNALIGAAVLLVVAVGALSWVALNMADDPETPPPPTIREGVALLKQDTGPVERAPAEDAADIAQPPDLGVTDLGDLPAGCGSPPPFTGEGHLLHTSGLTRTSRVVHIPATYDPKTPHPVVILLHRDAQTGEEILAQTRFGRLADKEGFIVLAPEDKEGGIYAWRQPQLDVALVADALDDVRSELCVDDERVFVVSHGSSGHAAEALSCEPWIRAVATNGFRTEKVSFGECTRPVPSLHLAAMKSNRMLVRGGKDCMVVAEPLSLDDHKEKWIARNKCTKRRKQTSTDADGRCFDYQGCEALYSICELDAGYGWPGNLEVTPPDPMGTCKDQVPKFDATPAVWAFFARVSG